MYFLLFVKKGRSSISGILFFILLASFLGDSISYIYADFLLSNNYIVINLWHIANFYLLAWLFSQILPEKRKLVLASIATFTILVVSSFSLGYSFWESNTFVWVTSNVIFILFPLFGFMELLKHPSGSLLKLPIFWILTTVLLYSSVTLLVNLFFQYLVFDLNISKEGFSTIMLILLISNTIKNFVFFYALVLIDKGFPDSIKPSQT